MKGRRGTQRIARKRRTTVSIRRNDKLPDEVGLLLIYGMALQDNVPPFGPGLGNVVGLEEIPAKMVGLKRAVRRGIGRTWNRRVFRGSPGAVFGGARPRGWSRTSASGTIETRGTTEIATMTAATATTTTLSVWEESNWAREIGAGRVNVCGCRARTRRTFAGWLCWYRDVGSRNRSGDEDATIARGTR